MAEPFIAEVRIFAGNFAPRGWAFCEGQILPIAQNTALFSLIGTIYGGDGRLTMALPNLKGRAPMGPGHGPGLTSRILGENGGAPTISLSTGQIPSHQHTQSVTAAPGNQDAPANDVYLAAGGPTTNVYNQNTNVDASMAFAAIPNQGGGSPHNNMQPYLALNFIIALVGLYPPRG